MYTTPILYHYVVRSITVRLRIIKFYLILSAVTADIDRQTEEEHEKEKAEKRSVEAPKRPLRDHATKDTEEKSKS